MKTDLNLGGNDVFVILAALSNTLVDLEQCIERDQLPDEIPRVAAIRMAGEVGELINRIETKSGIASVRTLVEKLEADRRGEAVQ